MEQFHKFNELTNYPVIIAQLNVSLCSSCISSCKPIYRIKLSSSLWLASFCWITFIISQSPLCLVLQNKHIFFVFRCYTVQVSYRIQWSRVQKGCVTKHCDLGLSGCLQVWPGAGGIINASSMICTSWSIWHWPNKNRTNLRPHRPKWKDVCSISHTRIEIPTSGSWRWQK